MLTNEIKRLREDVRSLIESLSGKEGLVEQLRELQYRVKNLEGGLTAEADSRATAIADWEKKQGDLLDDLSTLTELVNRHVALGNPQHITIAALFLSNPVRFLVSGAVIMTILIALWQTGALWLILEAILKLR